MNKSLSSGAVLQVSAAQRLAVGKLSVALPHQGALTTPMFLCRPQNTRAHGEGLDPDWAY